MSVPISPELLLPGFDFEPRQETKVPKNESELVLAFVGAVGVDLKLAEEAAAEKLRAFGYHVVRIRVTKDVLPKLSTDANRPFESDFERIWTMMDIGTEARRLHGSDVVALGIASAISESRPVVQQAQARTAYLVHSLKHPAEVRKLRELYPHGFYLIGVHSPLETRVENLKSRKGITGELAVKLMSRDRKEDGDFGQQLVDTFHLSDFFTGLRNEGVRDHEERNKKLLRNSIERFLEALFGHPNRTPTFGEYSMFLAFSAALRSADLSRQVGAVIARDGEILGTGANDCPKAGGGLYWPLLDKESLRFKDQEMGRDWTRGVDSNRKEQQDLIKNILDGAREEFRKEIQDKLPSLSSSRGSLDNIEKGLLLRLFNVLNQSKIRDLTEYGRVVHAEMEALLSCARKGISTRGATLYSTTFPCHNCAKHIIAAGIERVVFIEPYTKSRALSFHDDAIEMVYPSLEPAVNRRRGVRKVQFEPFSGIGPRRFFDLFSMEMGVGYELVRKERTGVARAWDESQAALRIQLMTKSYLERETDARVHFERVTGQRK